MKNKEKYRKDLSERDICDKASPWHAAVCHGNNCKGCAGRLIEWCEQEATPGITRLEEEVLKAVPPTFRYIARDKGGKLFVYYAKPRKGDEEWLSSYPCAILPLIGLFEWIRFEDDEPWCIDDLVKRHEILMNEDIKK